MNNVDKQYLAILNKILTEGELKQTRSGDTLSIFGAYAEFNLKEGLPLLTTKKVFYKGIIHELIWFLKGDTNIRYLVENNVNIWTDDAFRWFKSLDFKEYDVQDSSFIEGMYKLDRCVFELDELNAKYCLYDEVNQTYIQENCTLDEIKDITKEQFVDYTKKRFRIHRDFIWRDRVVKTDDIYGFGDLGPVYGKQWRCFGESGTDQIKNIIHTLKTNPDDRRMLCMAFNPDVLDKVALPPCHVMFQFYTRKLTHQERFNWLQENGDNKYDEWKSVTDEKLNELNVPERELSLSFVMRSNDYCCGNPYNIAQYSILCYIVCNICNMVPGKLIYFGNDVHVYCNHIEQAKEQLQRQGSDTLPQFVINRKLDDIIDLKYEDFQIINYHPDAPIKYPLNVG